MKTHLRPALTLFLFLTLVTGVAYPLVVWVCGQLVFPRQANGSIVERNGKALGSHLIGQPFDDPRYFWGRPSATDPVAYKADSSNASNLGPTNPDLLKAVGERVAALRKAHPGQDGPVPADLVTAAASGLDPHISPAAAHYQVARVAKARGLDKDIVLGFVRDHSEGRTFGVLGEPRVNVLRLNLALDMMDRNQK